MIKWILTESLEDYLDIILRLQETNRVARSKDIAENMGIQRGSVTTLLSSLIAAQEPDRIGSTLLWVSALLDKKSGKDV